MSITKLNKDQQFSLRHVTTFCLGIILSFLLVDENTRDVKSFLEVRTNAYKHVNFTGFDNTTANNGGKLIPNHIHLIRLNQPDLKFSEAVCLKSVFVIQRPDKIFVHTDDTRLRGQYWDSLFRIPGFKSRLFVKRVELPEKVFGNWFFWTAHRADLLRLLILRR